MDYCNAINVPTLLMKATLRDDDMGTTLRLHLLCERMVEAWICACSNCSELFGSEQNKVLIECSAKIAMAGNLGIPPALVKALKIFNSLRNDFAHKPTIQNVSDSRIQSLRDTLLLHFNQHPQIPSLDESEVGIFDEDGKLTEKVTLKSDSSKNRLKLIILFNSLMQSLMQQVASNHQGRWDNDFSQFTYKVTIKNN